MEYCLSRLERVRHSQVEAFETIFEQYNLPICRYLCSLVSDADLAEDLAQQTFLKAYRALSRGAPPDNLKAWLYAIATNTALSALRRRKVIQWLPFNAVANKAPGPGLEAHLGQQDLMARAFAKLPKRDVACLLLRFQHGLSYVELAEILSTSVPAVRMRISRARAAFREAYNHLSQEVDG